MPSNFLDWERKLNKTRRKKKKFSIYEAIFISAIKNIQPAATRELLKEEILKAGLSEEEYILVFDILKRKKILKYTINKPKGFYVEDDAVNLINKEYPKPIERVQSIQIEFPNQNNNTIDSFLKKKKKETNTYEELGITQEEMHQILQRWKENQKN